DEDVKVSVDESVQATLVVTCIKTNLPAVFLQCGSKHPIYPLHVVGVDESLGFDVCTNHRQASTGENLFQCQWRATLSEHPNLPEKLSTIDPGRLLLIVKFVLRCPANSKSHEQLVEAYTVRNSGACIQFSVDGACHQLHQTLSFLQVVDER